MISALVVWGVSVTVTVIWCLVQIAVEARRDK